MPHWRGCGACLGLGSSRPSEGRIMGIVGIKTWAWWGPQVWWEWHLHVLWEVHRPGNECGETAGVCQKDHRSNETDMWEGLHIASYSIIGDFCSYDDDDDDEHSSVKIAFHQHLWCDRQGTRYRGFHCELDRPTHCPLELVGYAKRTGQTACVMVAEYSMQLECVLLKSRCRKNSHWKGCSGWKAGGRVGDEGNPVLTEAASRMAIQKGGRYRAPQNLGCSPGLGPHGLCLVSTSSLLWRCLGFIPQQLGSYRLNTAGTWQNT